MVAPVIPGLNDEEIPRILEAAAAAGARHASWILLRLPGSVKAVFEERLRAELPERAERVLHRIRETRDGELYDARFVHRQRGAGAYAAAISDLFDAASRRVGLDTSVYGGRPPRPFAARARSCRSSPDAEPRGPAGAHRSGAGSPHGPPAANRRDARRLSEVIDRSSP